MEQMIISTCALVLCLLCFLLFSIWCWATIVSIKDKEWEYLFRSIFNAGISFICLIINFLLADIYYNFF